MKYTAKMLKVIAKNKAARLFAYCALSPAILLSLAALIHAIRWW